MESAGRSANLLVVGANHRSSAARTRDSLLLEGTAREKFLRLLPAAGAGQAVTLSTCARTEVQSFCADPASAAEAVTALFAERAGTDESAIASELYVKRGADAARHVFRLAAALDSPVVGDPQIAGQVREAREAARTAGTVGPELDALLDAALAAAGRVQKETPIGRRPVSMAAVARRLARDVHGDLSGCSALMLIGADMGELVADHILASGLRSLTVAARIPARAEAAARRRNCHHAPIDDLPELLAGSDIVVSALGTGRRALTAALLGPALARRRRRPILLLDAAVPGDIAPDVDSLEGAFVYGLADLERIAESGLARREDATKAAETILDGEIARYLDGGAGSGGRPALASLRARFEAARAEILAAYEGQDPAEATSLLVDRLLEAPAHALEDAGRGSRMRGELEAALAALFDIDGTRPRTEGKR